MAVFENYRGHAYILFEPFHEEKLGKGILEEGCGFWYGVLSELWFAAGDKEN